MAQLAVRLSPAEEQLAAQLHRVGADDAAAAFKIKGLPTRRVESYHYTDLKALLREVPELAEVATGTDAPALRLPGAYRLLIVNGEIQAAATAPAGVVVGASQGSSLVERDDVLVNFNRALVDQSLTLDLKNSVDPIIHVDRRIDGAAAHVADAVKISVADGASAVIVETYSGSNESHLTNHSTHVELGKDAKVTHIMVCLYGSKVRHMPTAEYDIGEGANLRTLVVNAGTVLSRSQVFANFIGEGAHADFTGLNLVEEGQHSDITLDIVHGVPNTTSTETYKTVARGRSRGIFQGKITVARDAQKTDAKMMAQGLLLSEEAEIFAKPELEIFADDVVCGHGATCGALDEDNLFYLMSRGLPKSEAQAMLIRGFLEELFDPIENENLHAALSDIAETWLQRGMNRAN